MTNPSLSAAMALPPLPKHLEISAYCGPEGWDGRCPRPGYCINPEKCARHKQCIEAPARMVDEAREPLTDLQIVDCVTNLDEYPLELVQVPRSQVLSFARAIERAHGITAGAASTEGQP